MFSIDNVFIMSLPSVLKGVFIDYF